jgi:hypothetical protein
MVLISLANFWIAVSSFAACEKPMVSPHPPTAIMIFAFSNSDRMVDIGTLGWNAAVLFAMANARTT